MEVRQRIMVNFHVKKDDLFSHFESDLGYIVPLAYIKREADLTQSQVKSILGDLMVAHTAKIAGTAILLSLGVILAAVGIFLMCKLKKIRQEEADSVTPDRHGKINLSNTDNSVTPN